MFTNRSVFNFLVLLVLLAGLGACQPPPATTTAKPPDTPKPGEPTSAPTPTPPEPVGWVFPENWWLEPQIWAQSPDSVQDYDGKWIMNLDYEAYTKAGLTVMNFFDTGEVSLQELHDHNIIVIGDVSMMTTYRLPFSPASELESPPELMEAAIRDPYGNIFRDPFGMDMFDWGKDMTFVIHSMLHPLWQEHLIQIMKAYVDAGVDGFLFDELAIGSALEPDFNPYTMQLFSRYLVETYNQEELEALGNPWGIENFSNFDYASLVREHLPTDMTVLTSDDWFNWELTGDLPLRRQFQRFLYIENQKVALHLINETRAYALKTRGIYLPVLANADPLVSPGLFLMDQADIFSSEIPYGDYNYFPAARTIAPLKLAHYFDIPLSFLSQMTSRPEMASWGKENTVNLYRTMIADATANGGSFNVEINRHDLDQDMDAIGPYYHFQLDYPILFEEVEPIRGNIAVLQLWESMVYSPYDHPALIGLFDLLADSGYQTNAVFGGGDEFIQWGDEPEIPAPDYPLNLSDLTPYPVIMIPELFNLTEGHAKILTQYMEDGGTLVIFSTPESTGDMDASTPLVYQILSARGKGPTEIGTGKLIHINGVWGQDFIENPDPDIRTQLVELLEAEGLQPEIKMTSARYLAATAYTSPEKMVVHFVNYDHEEGVDITTPTGPVDVEITLPASFHPDDPALYLFTPGEMPQEINGEISGDKLQLTLPGVYIWDVLLIGEKGTLGEQIAALPTITPTPIPPTLTPTLSPEQEVSLFIYEDAARAGWFINAWDGKIDLSSESVVHKGQSAIEANMDPWGAFGMWSKPLDTSQYLYLEFLINGGSQGGQLINVLTFHEDEVMTNLAIGDYTGTAELPPGEWVIVRIPVEDLNPDNDLVTQIVIENHSDDPAGTFYVDDIRFVSARP